METFTVQFAPGLRFEGGGYAVYGGLNQAPVEAAILNQGSVGPAAWVARELAVDSQEVRLIKHDLLADVMPLVDAAAASGAEIVQLFPQVLAFNLFGQAVAYFQSAQTVIASRQPVEALALLRGLVIIAARFEQMAQGDGGTLGLVVRLTLNALDDGFSDNVADRVAITRDDLLQSAARAGLRIPDDLPPVESTTIWRGLTAEMELARRSIEASFGIVGLHVKSGGEANRADFHIRLEPGPLTDLIASACVIAQLEVLKCAASVFGWMIDTGRVDALLAEARNLNDVSARAAD